MQCLIEDSGKVLKFSPKISNECLMMCYFSDASCLARVLLSRVDQTKFELETFKFERELSF